MRQQRLLVRQPACCKCRCGIGCHGRYLVGWAKLGQWYGSNTARYHQGWVCLGCRWFWRFLHGRYYDKSHLRSWGCQCGHWHNLKPHRSRHQCAQNKLQHPRNNHRPSKWFWHWWAQRFDLFAVDKSCLDAPLNRRRDYPRALVLVIYWCCL